MRWRPRGSRTAPLVGVVVPAYQVAGYLPACLDSLLEQQHRALDVLVVDDGSPDDSGEIAERYAARDPRVRVVHTANQGLGAARNEGLRHVRGDLLSFADSDDVVPPTAHASLVASLTTSGSDLATGSVARWEGGTLRVPDWMRRLHSPARQGLRAAEHPAILGDVFAWNKLYRRTWWEERGLSWAEGVRYEDQPTTTAAYLGGRFDVLEEVVYHWRIREDGSSITQQRATVEDLRDRFLTKRLALAHVESSVQAEAVLPIFRDRVLAGDMWRYLNLVPGCSQAWWDLLVAGVRELWGERSLLDTRLTPVHRLTGWLVTQDRRADAEAVVVWAAALGTPAPRVLREGVRCIDVAVLEPGSVPREALTLHAHER